MRLIVVGGQSRNVGKTAAVCEILAAFSDLPWTAVKITQFGHGVCSHSGRACECACEGEGYRLTSEGNARSRKDSARMLAAGARRALWLRCRTGELESALPALWAEVGGDPYVICESNSLVRFCRPDFYLSLLDPDVADWKASAREMLARADATLPPPHRLAPGLMARIGARLRVP